MKRFSSLILVILLLTIATLSGCKQNTSSHKLSVVCTIFPQYDWVRQILGDKVTDIELTILLDNKVDLHSYQPSVDDIAKISSCDLFIYVGGESDVWVEDALKSAINKSMVVINLLEVLGDSAKEEEIIEGMENDHDHTHDDEDEHNDDESDGHDEDSHSSDQEELDEHVWLSLNNAQIFCSVISKAISSLNTENSKTYQDNFNEYTEKLSALDTEYQSVINAASSKTLLFGDRFPFRYLVDDYGLNYYAAFAGCSAETEASFETIIFLAEKVDELSLKNILVTESSDKQLAATIKNNTTKKNQQILVLDSMQSVSKSEITDGVTYFSVMESNLKVLKDALE